MYFSARSASWNPLLFQHTTRCHSVFSCFSPPCPVHCRLVASETVATREPLLVLRTSGSAPKFPISMTLLRLRLTLDLRRMSGLGVQGCPTVYESQVILSIKDTPLVLKFCRRPHCRNGSPKENGVLDRTPVIVRAPPDFLEPQLLVQGSRHGVRCPHLEIDGHGAPRAEELEDRPAKTTPHPAPTELGCHR